MLAGLLAMALAAPAAADPVEDFYKGKNLNIYVGVSAGGAYDLQMRLVARHIVKHIPGRPTPVPQNMTGATGLVMANYLYRVAPKDGTAMGLIQNGLPTYQAVGMDGVQFDARQLQWIGSVAPTVETMIVWSKTGVKTMEDARRKEVVIGSIGASGITYMYPQMLNEMAGAKFKMVTGYPGSGALNLAIERGEVEGRNNSWGSVKANKPEWIRDGLISVLVYSGRTQKDLPGVPKLEEIITDPQDRKVAQVVTTGNRLGHPFAVAPGVPEDRVAALRKAFTQMLADPDFVKEATAAQIEIDAVTPEELKEVIDELFAVPDDLKQRARKYFEKS
jgi:tripartite-type tricarboxylate transporter receptor subunit TctC